MKEVSPSNITEYIKVSTVPSKVILTAMTILALGFIFWCFFGTITDRERIMGVVFPTNQSNTGVNVPNDGTVREILVHKGDHVTKGQTVALISIGNSYSILSAPYDGKVLSFIPEYSNFNAFEDIINLLPETSSGTITSMIAYADYTASRLIKPGQEIQATPKSETRERVGYIEGKVVSISQYPVSYQEAINVLQNPSLAKEIFPESSSVFQIEIEMLTETDNPDNLLWSFPNKETIDMSVGTFCNIEVTTKSRSVFKYLLENVAETRNSIRLWARSK